MISKEEFESHLQAAKDKGGKHVVFEFKTLGSEKRELLAYDDYEKYVADMKAIGFE